MNKQISLPHEAETAYPEVSSLVRMHCYKRPDGSESENEFIKDWLTPLGLDSDEQGNLYCRIGDAPVMWSSHTDTVHDKAGYQRLRLKGGMLQLTRKSRRSSSCLGADDGVGVWIMHQMILAGCPVSTSSTAARKAEAGARVASGSKAQGGSLRTTPNCSKASRLRLPSTGATPAP